MLGPRGAPPLHCLSLNVNGLREAGKRKVLFHCLSTGPWGLVALQETHHGTNEEAEQWVREGAGVGMPWQGTAEWCHGTTASRGVAVLISTSDHITNVSRHSASPDGRWLRIDLDIHGVASSFVAVYAPVERAERLGFFRELLSCLPSDGRQLIMAGDFNCIEDAVLDQRGGCVRTARLQGFVQGLQVVQERADLVDVFRALHPHKNDFTHIASNGAGCTYARIDRWLVPSSLIPLVTDAGMVDGLPGDHRGICLSFTAASNVPRGNGSWKFPLHLLNDEVFCNKLSADIAEYFVANPLHASLTRGARWDALKVRIRDWATQRGFEVGMQRRAELAGLEVSLRRSRDTLMLRPHDVAAVQCYQQANDSLRRYHERAAEAAALRAGVLWSQYGEQSTHWFHAQGRARQERSVITELAPAADAQPVHMGTDTGRRQGGKILADFYSSASDHGLFKALPVDIAAQDQLLATVDNKFTADDAAQCEGPSQDGRIAAAEALAALKTTPRGSVPGSDGLPYEFWLHFWPLLGDELIAVWDAVFAGHEAQLPESMRFGLISLLYKGKSLPRHLPGSYRPITLLNCDGKLLSKVLARRFGGPLHRTLDVTQTAFLPHRWIGDNVLGHLEEIDYCTYLDEPGCQIILDFDKAFDRLNRGWVLRCMETLGFGQGSQRWVSLLLANTCAAVAYNGWRTKPFPVESGTPQGAPLSPILYVIGAQPLASHLRRLGALGTIHPITMPDGNPAPICHQHADDTSIHTRTLADGIVAMRTSVTLFSSATSAVVSWPKTKALLLGPEARAFPGGLHTSGITCVKDGEAIVHLGIPMGRGVQHAQTAMFGRILGNVSRQIGHWSARDLSFLGRVHIARSVLASSVYYHATFAPPASDVLTEMCSRIYGYVSSGRQSGPSALHPRRMVAAMPWEHGGIRLPELETQLQAMHAGIIMRLLEPERHPWKVYMLSWLGRDAGWYARHPDAQMRDIDCWGYGLRTVFSQYDLSAVQMPARVRKCIAAFRALQVHRAQPDHMSVSQVLREPLFHNPRVHGVDAMPLDGAIWKAVAQAGVRRVADLAGEFPAASPQLQAQLTACLPPEWAAAIRQSGGAYEAQWQLSSSGTVAWRMPARRFANPAAYRVMPSGRLVPLLCASADASRYSPEDCTPAAVQNWDGSRPWKVASRQANPEAANGEAPYLLGTWDSLAVDPAVWAAGAKHPVAQYVIRKGALRLRTLALTRQLPGYKAGIPIQPKIWEVDGESGIHVVQQRWADRAADEQQQTAWEATGSLPHWMRPSPPRQLPLARAAAREPAAPTPPRRRAAHGVRDDTVDVAAVPSPSGGPLPWLGAWSCIRLPSLPREHKALAWKLLHAALPCNAFRRYIHLTSDSRCQRSGCTAAHETLEHVFLECHVAQKVMEWLARLWVSVDPAAGPPPCTAAVMLAGDCRTWRPSVAPSLWTVLRLATLHALWRSRSARSQVACTAAGVACQIIHGVRHCITLEWQRVISDIRRESNTCAESFRGRDPRMSREDFEERWCTSSAICRITTDSGRSKLDIVFGPRRPIPLPVG